MSTGTTKQTSFSTSILCLMTSTTPRTLKHFILQLWVLGSLLQLYNVKQEHQAHKHLCDKLHCQASLQEQHLQHRCQQRWPPLSTICTSFCCSIACAFWPNKRPMSTHHDNASILKGSEVTLAAYLYHLEDKWDTHACLWFPCFSNQHQHTFFYVHDDDMGMTYSIMLHCDVWRQMVRTHATCTKEQKCPCLKPVPNFTWTMTPASIASCQTRHVGPFP